MSYEPAINTTVSSTEKTRYWLERAVEAANNEGVIIVGFIVKQCGEDTVFDPFSSSHALEPKQFVELVALAARQMIVDDQPSN